MSWFQQRFKLLALVGLIAIVAAQLAIVAHGSHCATDAATSRHCPFCLLVRSPWLGPPEPVMSTALELVGVATTCRHVPLCPCRLPRTILSRAPPGLL